MKHILKNSIKALVLIVMLGMISSCNDEDAKSNLPSAIYPKSIGIVIPQELEQLVYVDTELGVNVLPLIKGETATLSYTIQPEEITFDDVIWTSSNKDVATVIDGKITAVNSVGTGYAIIQVAPDPYYSGSNIFGTLKVVVSNTLIPAESISIDSKEDEVFIGETLQLTASILPKEATYRTVKWISSNEAIAKVDKNGLVTGVENDAISSLVTITATSLDGAKVIASKDITVKKVVQPESVTIDQQYSVTNNYFCAINEKTVQLKYTTVPEYATLSLIEWKSSNEAIATVNKGIVTFNQEGVFGDVTITATCPETGQNSSIKLNIAEGLVRELFHNSNYYSWYNAQQSGNGTSSSHVWSYGKLTVTTYNQNATNQRGDFKCWSPKTWLHVGNYPIFAIRMEDAKDLNPAITSRNITLDGSGISNSTAFSGGLDGNNNKWLYDYKCSDGSHVFIYDLSKQKWATGGVLPTNAVATFSTLQFKYADIRTIDHQLDYNVYWVQTFKTIDDVKAYIGSEGLSYQ